MPQNPERASYLQCTARPVTDACLISNRCAGIDVSPNPLSMRRSCAPASLELVQVAGVVATSGRNCGRSIAGGIWLAGGAACNVLVGDGQSWLRPPEGRAHKARHHEDEQGLEHTETVLCGTTATVLTRKTLQLLRSAACKAASWRISDCVDCILSTDGVFSAAETVHCTWGLCMVGIARQTHQQLGEDQ